MNGRIEGTKTAEEPRGRNNFIGPKKTGKKKVIGKNQGAEKGKKKKCSKALGTKRGTGRLDREGGKEKSEAGLEGGTNKELHRDKRIQKRKGKPVEGVVVEKAVVLVGKNTRGAEKPIGKKGEESEDPRTQIRRIIQKKKTKKKKKKKKK